MKLKYLNKIEYKLLASRGFYCNGEEPACFMRSFGIAVINIAGTVFAVDEDLYDRFLKEKKHDTNNFRQ